MARSKKRTTADDFFRIKKLRSMGMSAEDVADFMNFGESRIYCIDKFDTYEEFMNGAKQFYERWRKTPRKNHNKKTEEEKAPAKKMIAEVTPEEEKEFSQDLIIQLLIQINEQLAIIVGELT